MIAAGAAVVDLDPDGWAVLHSLVLAARRRRQWGYVLHSAGEVLTTYPPSLQLRRGQRVPDADALAAELLDQTGFDRVVVIDRDRLPDLARAGAALVTPDGDLTTYRERVDDLYWSSVATAPAPAANPWRSMRLLAESVGHGLVHLQVTDGDEPLTGIALTVVDGVVVQVSSPASQDEAEVVLAVTDSEFVSAIGSADLVEALLTAASRHELTRGLERLRSCTVTKGHHA